MVTRQKSYFINDSILHFRNRVIWVDFYSPVTHAGPGIVNNPDLAFVKNVLAVAPKVTAMVNLFLKLPKKLIGLKKKKAEVSLINVFHALI